MNCMMVFAAGGCFIYPNIKYISCKQIVNRCITALTYKIQPTNNSIELFGIYYCVHLLLPPIGLFTNTFSRLCIICFTVHLNGNYTIICFV